MRGDFVPSGAVLEDRTLSRQAPHMLCAGEARARRRAGRAQRRFYSTSQVRLAWEHAGADLDSPHVQEMIDRGIGPVSQRMPTGVGGAAFMTNLPPEGEYVMNTAVFGQNTERNDVPMATQAWPGMNEEIEIPIAKVGILAGAQIIINATLKTGGAKGTITPTFRWPWGLIKRLAVSANGQTSLIRPTGLDMRARHARVFRNPRDSVSTAPSINEFGEPTLKEIERGKELTVQLVYEVPIVHDWYTLTGALFMQSDQTYAALNIATPTIAELFTLTEEATVEVTKANFQITTTTFDVPFANTSKGKVLLVPNLQWLHGFIHGTKNFSNKGDVEVPLIRVSGELLCAYLFMRNGSSLITKPSKWEAVRMQYGGNRIPRNYRPVQHLLMKNSDDYNGLVLPEAGYLLWDFEADNPSRDLVFPKGVTELMIVPTISEATEVKENSAVEFAEEALFAGR